VKSEGKSNKIYILVLCDNIFATSTAKPKHIAKFKLTFATVERPQVTSFVEDSAG